MAISKKCLAKIMKNSFCNKMTVDTKQQTQSHIVWAQVVAFASEFGGLHIKQTYVAGNRISNKQTNKETPWLLVRKRTISTDRAPLVGDISGNLCG
jgi:hypothetical protein